MGKLIDADEIKKMYPIMENDFGMVVNDRLHKNLDKIPPAEAILKVDMVTILDKIKAEIEALNPVDYVSMSSYEGHRGVSDMKDDVLQIIDKYKEEKDAT